MAVAHLSSIVSVNRSVGPEDESQPASQNTTTPVDGLSTEGDWVKDATQPQLKDCRSDDNEIIIGFQPPPLL
jgi:hypothetical protein